MNSLSSPLKIQTFLDETPYSTEPIYRSPLSVLRDHRAHCFDGALFAAAALRRLGYPPLIVEMLPNERDDDHLLAVYKRNNHWGAVAKSNFVGLRYREPIYRTLRELLLSYFEDYFNIAGEKTLRGYTLPLNLTTCDRWNWMTEDEHLDEIAKCLDRQRRVNLLTQEMEQNLAPVDKRRLKAGLLGADPEGLYKPKK
ncbi:MAG TPA: hypothetical protein P5268_07190 [Candidatus Marinimicrobia bacterium]|nr:hypothetical protein [Candidatus Neomarinimicrobiota bacterium]HRU92799.1 hypothetical protein [Candidatus Neomarinimicrobiota bacterium]